jgi:hypothetical protein
MLFPKESLIYLPVIFLINMFFGAVQMAVLTCFYLHFGGKAGPPAGAPSLPPAAEPFLPNSDGDTRMTADIT